MTLDEAVDARRRRCLPKSMRLASRATAAAGGGLGSDAASARMQSHQRRLRRRRMTNGTDMHLGKLALHRHSVPSGNAAKTRLLADRPAGGAPRPAGAFTKPLDNVPAGILYMIAATVLFAVTSAIAKWLVAIYPVGEVMFFRSLRLRSWSARPSSCRLRACRCSRPRGRARTSPAACRSRSPRPSPSSPSA